MARVTVDRCLQAIPNRFDLVRVAARRAHQLNATDIDPLIPKKSNKNTVVALREIESGLIDADKIQHGNGVIDVEQALSAFNLPTEQEKPELTQSTDHVENGENP